MPACLQRRFSSASRSAIGMTYGSSISPPSHSRSLITSSSTRATADLSGTIPCRSSFLAGISLFLASVPGMELKALRGGTTQAGQRVQNARVDALLDFLPPHGLIACLLSRALRCRQHEAVDEGEEIGRGSG